MLDLDLLQSDDKQKIDYILPSFHCVWSPAADQAGKKGRFDYIGALLTISCKV